MTIIIMMLIIMMMVRMMMRVIFIVVRVSLLFLFFYPFHFHFLFHFGGAVPPLELAQGAALSAPGDSVVADHAAELTPQTHAQGVSAHRLHLDHHHHLGLWGIIRDEWACCILHSALQSKL